MADKKNSLPASNYTKDLTGEKTAERVKEIGVPCLAQAPKKIEKKTLSFISEESALKYQMAAFERKGNQVKVAMVDPQNVEALNVLRFISKKDAVSIEIYLVSLKNFQEIVGQYSTAEKALAEAIESLKDEQEEQSRVVKRENERVQKIIQDAPIAKLVQVIIKHAIDGRASDIHIEPAAEDYRVRFRVDGVLHASLSLPKEVGRAVISRVKILSNLKIDERRKPQDGRFQMEESGYSVDFRVSTLPVIEGEKVVMRVLEKDENIFNLDVIGLMGSYREILTKRISDPYGIILVTGPTGSGKSTTLYSFLQILNKEDRNIITLEDPIEYHIEGINQSQIKPEIGYDFASGLRSILRQDPNVIMVGEIRDSETAELAIHAALTGHLVFSTLHTNDAIGTIPRLVDMGVEPFLLASSLRLVAAQRLVRRICQHCRRKVELPPAVYERVKKELKKIDPEEMKKYGLSLPEEVNFFQGKGCEECGGTGYKGRVAIFEALEVDEDIQNLISGKRDSELEIRENAKKRKMVSMFQDGIIKAVKGLTSLSEVERVTEGSMSVGGEVDDDRG